jgi:hypothetical protein
MAVGKGKQHVKDVSSLSTALVQSGRADPGTHFLALNPHGWNCERDFHRKMNRVLRSSFETYPLELTVRGPGASHAKLTIGVLPAYEVFALVCRSPELMQKALLGNYDKSCLVQYWDIMRQSSWNTSNVFQNPVLWAERHQIFPVFWHSDGGEMFKGTSYNVAHWSTPFGHDCDPYDVKMFQLMIEDHM